MRFSLTEEQTALRDTVRELLERQCPPALVRDPESAALSGLWKQLADVGVFGVAVPESAGGLGLTVADLVPVLIEVGAAAVPLPVAETALVAAPLLGDPALAAGVARVAVARSADLVPYAAHADRALLLDTGRHGALRSREPLSTVDISRAAGRVVLDTPAVLDPERLRHARLHYDLAIAAQQIGLGRRMLAMTVDYVGQRRQFGAPVGSFQAVAHHLSDALLAVEFAEPAVLAAGWTLAYAPGHAPPEVAGAAVLATEAAQLVARTAIQCHGAIGYTVEYDLNLYAKRAWALAAECPVDAHLSQLGRHLGLEES